MAKIITIEIDEKGATSLDLAGFQGRGCAKVAADFTADSKVGKEVTKREYSQETAQKATVKERA